MSQTSSPPEIPPLLTVDRLSVFYAGRAGLSAAVKNISFDVLPGEFVAIVGQSGSGKSTTVHSIIDLLPPGAMRQAETLLFDGQELSRLRERQLRFIRGKEIGFVPQDPTISLDPVKTIGFQICEALKVHRVASGKAAVAAAIQMLDEVGIDRPSERFSQYPHEISGGMRQRVLIAIALACGPKLVIADEPTSGLDVTVQKRVLDKMAALIQQRGTAVLFITHDLGVAADRADRIIVMNEGQIVETGKAADVIRAPQSDYTRALLRDIPRRPAPLAATGVKIAPVPQADDATVLLVASSLTKHFKSGWFSASKGTPAVDGVSLQIDAGKTLALVGESGSGKTTVARMLAGLTRPTGGQVLVAGGPARGPSGVLRVDYHALVQFVYQNPFSSLNPSWRIEDIIRDPMRVNQIGNATEQRRRVRELTDAVGLANNLLDRRAGELSGGQLQRVAIARALSLNPKILVLDEPTSALDVTVQARILTLLQDVQREFGLSYLFVTHDLAVVNLLADRVAVMKSGRIVESGTKEQVLTSPDDTYTRALINAVPGRLLDAGYAPSSTEPHLSLIHSR